MQRTEEERDRRKYWRFRRWQRSGDMCQTVLHGAPFEQTYPDLVIEEIRRGPHGHLRKRRP